MYRPLIASAIAASLAGCTNQDVYDSVQRDKARRCIEKPQSQYEECMRQANISYREYEQLREELLESESN